MFQEFNSGMHNRNSFKLVLILNVNSMLTILFRVSHLNRNLMTDSLDEFIIDNFHQGNLVLLDYRDF